MIKNILFVFSVFYALSVNGAAVVNIYKSATCGCCSKWAKYLEQHGFHVKTHSVKKLTTIKKKAHLPAGMGSCHTAFVEGYVIEGHVFSEDINRLLIEKPSVYGLVTPGMPIGSPGMERGNQKEQHITYSYTKKGKLFKFSSH